MVTKLKTEFMQSDMYVFPSVLCQHPNLSLGVIRAAAVATTIHNKSFGEMQT